MLFLLIITVITFLGMYDLSAHHDPGQESPAINATPSPPPEESPTPSPPPEESPTPTPGDPPDTSPPPQETPAPVESPSPPPPDNGINYLQEGGLFELPVTGATGYTSVSLKVFSEIPVTREDVIITLPAGRGFTILDENDTWWKILTDDAEGWVSSRLCFINLPDIIPSIVYKNTNASSSMLRSMGFDIPNVTSKQLYEAHTFNQRLDKDEYIIPVLYRTAIMLSKAQQAALADGNTIIMNEAFRPREVQRLIVRNMQRLMDSNTTVNEAITTPPWSMNWFVSPSLSNHQRGAAIDISLGKVITSEDKKTGDYAYTLITEYNEYVMPTAMHELSPRAAVFKNPVQTSSPDDWKVNGVFTDSMTDSAKLMQRYMTNVGFTPLSSEWWHFNDLEGRALAIELGINGEYLIDSVYSIEPVVIQ